MQLKIISKLNFSHKHSVSTILQPQCSLTVLRLEGNTLSSSFQQRLKQGISLG